MSSPEAPGKCSSKPQLLEDRPTPGAVGRDQVADRAVVGDAVVDVVLELGEAGHRAGDQRHDAPADGVDAGVGGEGGHQVGRPRRSGHGVVVGEGDDVSLGGAPAPVAGGRRAGVVLPQVPHRCVPGDDTGDVGRGRAVVHDDDLEALAAGALLLEGVEQPAERVRSFVGRDHDAQHPVRRRTRVVQKPTAQDQCIVTAAAPPAARTGIPVSVCGRAGAGRHHHEMGGEGDAAGGAEGGPGRRRRRPPPGPTAPEHLRAFRQRG